MRFFSGRRAVRRASPGLWHRGRGAAVAIAVVAVTATALPGTAAAAGLNIQRIFSMTPPTTSEPAQAFGVMCPAGTQAIGLGGAVNHGFDATFGNVVLNGLGVQVFSFGAAATAQAGETDFGESGAWNLMLYATCSDPVPGFEVKNFATPFDSAPAGFKRLDARTARCPAGKKMLSAGGWVAGSNGQPQPGSVIIDDITPSADLTGVNVTAWEDATGAAENWSLQALVVCANPLPGLELRTSTSFNNSFTDKTATVNCSAGKRVLSAAGDITGPNGTGGDSSGATGKGLMDEISLSYAPSPEGAKVVTRKVGGGPSFNETWFPHAYAICAAV
jgi:hypothetical protein